MLAVGRQTDKEHVHLQAVSTSQFQSDIKSIDK